MEDITGHCPREAVSIMKQCWAVNPEDRPTFAGEHLPWLHGLRVVIFLVRCRQEVALSF